MAQKESDQVELSQQALDMKNDGDQRQHHPESEDHADTGMVSKPFADQAPSGAFDAEGHRPALERSRKVR